MIELDIARVNGEELFFSFFFFVASFPEVLEYTYMYLLQITKKD